MKFTSAALLVSVADGAYPAIRDLVVVKPPVNSEGTCGEKSLWAAWKQTSDCCNGPVKQRIYYERTCKNTDCECYGATTAYVPCSTSCYTTPTPAPTQPTTFCYWTGWSEWESAEQSCQQTALRSCQTNSYDKNCCEGSPYKNRPIPGCDFNGKIWGDWSNWSDCVGNVSTRRRDCVSSNPDLCQGYLTTQRSCGTSLRIWGDWSAWSSCYDSKKTRSRPCVANDASICQGTLSVVEPCNSTRNPTTPFDASFCTFMNRWSLSWCLNYNIKCSSWLTNNYAQKGLACASRTWGFNQAQIDRMFSIFGVYLTSSP